MLYHKLLANKSQECKGWGVKLPELGSLSLQLDLLLTNFIQLKTSMAVEMHYYFITRDKTLAFNNDIMLQRCP